MEAKYIAFVIAAAILIAVIELIRRQKMTFKYSLAWLTASGAVLFFSINHTLLSKISKLAGFELMSNFVFFLLISFFVVLSLLLTIYVNEQNSRSEILAQSLGILKLKLETLEKKHQTQ